MLFARYLNKLVLGCCSVTPLLVIPTGLGSPLLPSPSSKPLICSQPQPHNLNSLLIVNAHILQQMMSIKRSQELWINDLAAEMTQLKLMIQELGQCNLKSHILKQSYLLKFVTLTFPCQTSMTLLCRRLNNLSNYWRSLQIKHYIYMCNAQDVNAATLITDDIHALHTLVIH